MLRTCLSQAGSGRSSVLCQYNLSCPSMTFGCLIPQCSSSLAQTAEERSWVMFL